MCLPGGSSRSPAPDPEVEMERESEKAEARSFGRNSITEKKRYWQTFSSHWFWWRYRLLQ